MKNITRLCIVLFISIFTSYIGSTYATNLNTQSSNNSNEIQRVRIDFVSPDKYTRHLLLSFTPDDSATDGFDYGYDGVNPDDFLNDLNWIIEAKRYIIQGVGAFDESKQYPLGLFLTDSGDIEISLSALENFDIPINVYIYDKLLDTYTQINDSKYISTLDSGDYLNRFYIAFFEANEALSTYENELQKTIINYLSNTKEIYINTFSQNTIKQIQVYNLLGQKLSSIININSTEIKIPVNYFTTNYAIVSIETDYGNLARKIIVH